MSEEKFMNYGRVIILVFTALIGMLFTIMICSTAYERIQKNELTELLKEESRLESKLLEIQILKIEKELQKIN